jgi:phage tail sheath protein FI
MWSVVYNKYYNEISTDINDFVKVASYNDEDGFPDTYIQNIGSKIRGGGSIGTDTQARLLDPFRSIHEYFTKFAGTNRKDLIYIADPLRQIFVKGRSYKVEDGENFNFSSQIFWPLYHLFENTRSSYVCSYANWVKVTDSNTARSTWIPSSGAVAGVMMASDQNTFPWTPVAGFNRGTIDGLLDVGISPSQRDRDLLYKISMNPIANFTNDGIVIFGQKTMFTKPSAFDRINVRRLFITLEKYVSRAVKYFVFEPNTYFTRSRIVSTLRPLFDNARQNDGLYDYRIVCDERNNTPDVIDNNQLKVDIYIKPTRTAEFILVNFFATRTDQNFDEILPL